MQAGDSDHYLHDRLAFEEGLVYYFRFDEHRHTLVCSDRLYVQERIAGGPVRGRPDWRACPAPRSP